MTKVVELAALNVTTTCSPAVPGFVYERPTEVGVAVRGDAGGFTACSMLAATQSTSKVRKILGA